MKFSAYYISTLILPPMILMGCSSGSSSGLSFSGSSSSTLLSNQTFVRKITNLDGSTCDQVTRDTTPCESNRTSLGLSGNWLAFSCDVELGLADASKVTTTNYAAATYITVTTHGMPDHKSNYYPTFGTYNFTANGITYAGNFSDMHMTYTPSFPNPNTIADKPTTLYIPKTPTPAGTITMPMGTIGVAIDGSSIYNNLAAGTDNIFAEAYSFDPCHGHPSGDSRFHFHAEPYPISYDDNKLIGVLRDGYFVYGRRDYDTTYPGDIASEEAAGSSSNIYKYGGHVGPDPVTNTGSVFHYHLTEWEGCYNESGGVKAADDGETNDTINTGVVPNCGGTWVDTWFLTGHGNGGVYATIPSVTLNNQSPSQTVAGVRYYYGTPGSCTGC